MKAVLEPAPGGAPLQPIFFHDVEENIVWRSHRATRRETATTIPGGREFVRWATVIFDAKSLLPYFSEYRRKDGLFVRHEFDGLHVKETRTSLDVLTSPPLTPGQHFEIIDSDFDLPEPAFTWIENTGLPILLSLPLREGLNGSVPVISGNPESVKACIEAPCHVLRMSYQVIGKETITGISGKPVVTWKISVPETRFTFWIACKKPRLEQVYWPGPGGKGAFSMAPVQ